MHNETQREQEQDAWRREQERMERWERRGRFFKSTVIGDFTLPPLGIVGLILLAIMRVKGWEPYVACLAVITAPAGGIAIDAIREALSRRQPPKQ